MTGKQHYLLRAALTAIVASAATAGAQAPDTGRKIDPDAMAALSKMGTYLRSLSAIQVKANITTEDVTDDGQKIQSLSSVDMIAKRPDRMRVEVVNASKPRTFYYDGKNFTLWAPRTKYYATVAAPATINELIDKLEDKYNIQFPLVDLFRWGVDKSDSTDITSATYVGPSAVNGITANQYAFRQPGADWQVWIQTGEYPLPLRAVITTTTDDARPQHETTYTWNLAPSFSEQAFAFSAPPDAKPITFAEAGAPTLGIKVKKSGDKK
ncbi:MAG TPA: DUF2092 domain-containing protein [Gemmatimonadaceae bacterium]|nr:DUF2092 domain-containing protein [Gemmatimonadaceae bacterium]